MRLRGFWGLSQLLDHANRHDRVIHAFSLMRFLLQSVMCLVALLCTNARCHASSSTESPDIVLYEQQLQGLAPTLTNHDYFSNYLRSAYDKPQSIGSCPANAFCRINAVKKMLTDIQTGNFAFISPTVLPMNGLSLLESVEKYTNCENLGFMNVIDYPDKKHNAAPTPWRPTQGFAIYRVQVNGHQIVLVRGSDYNIAWWFWGADISGPRLPPIPEHHQQSPGPNFIFEINPQNCTVIRRIDITAPHGNNEVKVLSFSEPIIEAQQVFLLSINSTVVSGQVPEYSLSINQISYKRGRQNNDLFFATFFDNR